MTGAIICDAVRTPIGHYRGAPSSMRADDPAAVPLRALMQRNGAVDWDRLSDASAEAACADGLTRRAPIEGGAVSDVPSWIMGVGPAPASRKLLRRLGLALGDMDMVELNEAFAAQALPVLRQLGMPDDAQHVHPSDGAIALGHPAGISGARLALTAGEELHRRGGRYALCTMCIGVGQGIALVLERV